MNSGRLPHTILRAASLLTPSDRRAEWVQEWQSELWYIRTRQANFCLGAFRDALYVRRTNHDPAKRRIHLESPRSCLAFLALLAAASILIVLILPVPHPEVFSPLKVRDLPRACIGMLLFSCLFLAGTVPVWRRPANCHPLPWRRRLRRATFLALKVALVQPMMLCGFFVEIRVLPLASFAFYAAFILVLRWVIVDQQQRCPVCLRLLTRPVHIGNPSRTFLEWYGAELACSHGHGLLHVSESPSGYSRRPQWLCLGDSWKDLFAAGGKRHA